MSEIVDKVVQHIDKAVPFYVSAMPSIYTALGVTLAVLLLGGGIVFQDFREGKSSVNLLRRFRWVLLLGLLVAVCSAVYDFTQERVFQVHMLRANSRHFAVVHWLRQYRRALTA